MKVDLDLTPEEETEINNQAQQLGMDLNTFIMEAIYDKFEDQFDLVTAEKALRQHRTNPITYSFKEVIKQSKKSK